MILGMPARKRRHFLLVRPLTGRGGGPRKGAAVFAAAASMDGFATRRLTAVRPGDEDLADLTALRLGPEVARGLGSVMTARSPPPVWNPITAIGPNTAPACGRGGRQGRDLCGPRRLAPRRSEPGHVGLVPQGAHGAQPVRLRAGLSRERDAISRDRPCGVSRRSR